MEEQLVNKLINIMRSHGVAQKTLCKQLDLPDATVRDWVSKKRKPRLDKFCEVLAAFNYRMVIVKNEEPLVFHKEVRNVSCKTHRWVSEYKDGKEREIFRKCHFCGQRERLIKVNGDVKGWEIV